MDYDEFNLPTTDTGPQRFHIPVQQVIPGDEIYRWERSVAHISDLTWDARQQLHERELKLAVLLLEHAYTVAADLRNQIRKWQLQEDSHAHFPAKEGVTEDLHPEAAEQKQPSIREATDHNINRHQRPNRRTPVERAEAPVRRQQELRRATSRRR